MSVSNMSVSDEVIPKIINMHTGLTCVSIFKYLTHYNIYITIPLATFNE